MDHQYGSELPERWRKELTGVSLEEAAAQLSMHRTEMSTHRTFMSTARSHMSNERTHLAYLRTSLSLMSFGITMNRFSLFLRDKEAKPGSNQILRETELAGLGIVFLSIALLAWALVRYKRVSLAIETDNYTNSISAMRTITWGILVLGGFTMIWMFFSRG